MALRGTPAEHARGAKTTAPAVRVELQSAIKAAVNGDCAKAIADLVAGSKHYGVVATESHYANADALELYKLGGRAERTVIAACGKKSLGHYDMGKVPKAPKLPKAKRPRKPSSPAQKAAQTDFKDAVAACKKKGETTPRNTYLRCVSGELKRIKKGR